MIKVVDAVFNPVGSITVKNPELARVYMEDFLNDMRVYLPGTFFKIIKNSKNIQLVNDEADNKGTGIWTGWFMLLETFYTFFILFIILYVISVSYFYYYYNSK